MPPKKCCCVIPCELGQDSFERPDSSDPGPLWKLISGYGNIVSGHIEVDGVVATRICHPASHVHGSFRATFELFDLRTVSLFEVGVGDPSSSTYYVRFEPSGMDTGSAQIRVTVVGDTTEIFDYVWPSAGAGSANIVSALVCYEPGALLRGSIQPPSIDVCIAPGGSPCYTSGGDDVGGFFFKKGHFDQWLYEETILDNFNCTPCGCFCFRRSGADREFNCYPEILYLHLTVSTGYCPALVQDIELTQGQLSPGDGYPEKIRWFSPILECGGYSYTFVFECSAIVKDGTNWLISGALRLTDASYVDNPVLMQWNEFTVTSASRQADFDTSTCEPLSLVYPGLKLNSFYGPCGYPGEFGHYLFCCPSVGCSPTPPNVLLEAVITE